MAQSSSELTTIHLRRLATPGRKYYGNDEKVYIGTDTRQLRLLDVTSNSVYQNAVGSILTDTSTIDFSYNSSTPSITADLNPTSVIPGVYGSATLSPQITIDSTGRITSAVNQVIALTNVANLYEASSSLTSAQILTLFTTPITIIAAPGAGKYIQVVAGTVELTFVSAAYATATIIGIRTAGANANQAQSTIFPEIASRIWALTIISSLSNAIQMIDNASLQIMVAGANPTGGNGTIKIKILYRIITI